MASNNRCRVVPHRLKSSARLISAPRSSDEVLLLIKCARDDKRAGAEIMRHLEEMEARFPTALLAAFRAFLKRQSGAN